MLKTISYLHKKATPGPPTNEQVGSKVWLLSRAQISLCSKVVSDVTVRSPSAGHSVLI